MNFNNSIIKLLVVCAFAGPAVISCSSDDPAPVYEVVIAPQLPEGYVIDSQTINFTEVNTGVVTTVDNPNNLMLSPGTYNIEATAKVSLPDSNGSQKTMRAVAQNVVITETSRSVTLDWFFYNPDNSLVISEIYLGSLNATGKGLLYDSYIEIYNNTDSTIYADGLAICEGTLNNSTSYPELTPTPEEKFLVGTVYVIPGNGKDHPIEPGKAIKIVDQAIDWSKEVSGAQDHSDADFEWYDEVTVGTVHDTDNPAANLDKWYSYSSTIWILSQQANRSYAIARIPEGVDAKSYLTDYSTSYTYYFTFTNKYVTQSNKYYIPLDWIIDGVNLCPASTQLFLCLPPSVDISYKSINDDPQSASDRAYRKFVRREAGKSPEGNIILQDTDDSAKDFKIVNLNTSEELN